MVLGTVQETGRVEHRMLCPPGLSGRLVSLAPEGDYTVEEPIGVLVAEGPAARARGAAAVPDAPLAHPLPAPGRASGSPRPSP